MSIKKKKRPVLGYLPINVENNSSTHNNTLNVSIKLTTLKVISFKIYHRQPQNHPIYLFLNLLLPTTTTFHSIPQWSVIETSVVGVNKTYIFRIKQQSQKRAKFWNLVKRYLNEAPKVAVEALYYTLILYTTHYSKNNTN